MLELPVFSCTSTSFWRPCARHPSKAVFVSDFSLKHVVTVHYTGSFDDGEVFENRTLVIILLDANGSDVDSIVDATLELDGVSSVAKETYGSGFGLVTN